MRDPHKAVVYVTLRLRTTPLSIHTGALQSWKKSTINEQLHCISCSWVQFIQPRDWHITFSWVCLTIAAFQSKWSIFHSSGYSRGLQADFIILILLTKKKILKKRCSENICLCKAQNQLEFILGWITGGNKTASAYISQCSTDPFSLSQAFLCS